MQSPALRLCLAVLTSLLLAPAWAEGVPAKVYTAPGIEIENFGVYCNLTTTGRKEAPGTTLGYIDLLSGIPEFVLTGHQVPARIGISFGVVMVSDHTISNVRIVTLNPGSDVPEIWHTSYSDHTPTIRGFRFDYDYELIPGTWRMEAYENKTLLYSVEFEVLPGTELPGVSSDCNLTS